MNSDDAVLALSALAYRARLEILRLLIRAGSTGLSAGRIAECCGLSASTLSFHLNQLRTAGLVSNRRDGRSLIYRANPPLIDTLIGHLSETLSPPAETAPQDSGIINVLFVGTGNSGRSIMAETVLAQMGRGRFQAYSAGVRHTGRVSGLAFDVLARAGYPAAGMRSKPLEMFTQPDAVASMHVVITVSEEAVPLNMASLPGAPVHAHWPTPDPQGVVGTEVEIVAVYESVLASLLDRVSALAAQSLRDFDPLSLKHRLDAIGRHARLEEEAARGVA